MKKLKTFVGTLVLSAFVGLTVMGCGGGGGGGSEVPPYNGNAWVDDTGDGYDDNTGWSYDGKTHESGNPYDENGKKSNGQTWRDDQGYDYLGYNTAGIDRDGYDRDGFLTTMTPVAKAILVKNDEYFSAGITQNLIYKVVKDYGKDSITAQSGLVKQAFTNAPNGQCPPALLASVVNNADRIGPDNYTGHGDNIVGNSLKAISGYIVTLTCLVSQEKQEKFTVMMNAYRTKAYADNRSYTGSGINNTAPAELDALHAQLNSMGVNKNNIVAEITGICKDIGLNPALAMTLLNQIAGVEHFYSVVDDIKAINLKPVVEDFYVSGYIPSQPVRTQTEIQTRLTVAWEEHNHSQECNQGMGI